MFRTRPTLVVAAVALSVTLGACGASTADSGKTASSPGSSSVGPTSPEVATAQKVLDDYAATPTKISQRTALPSAPPTGKKIIWMNCDIPTCTTEGEGIKAAAEAVGWEYEAINYESANPATLTAAMNQALAKNPTVVVESGVSPEAGWSSVLPAYQAAGVPVISSYIATPSDQLPDGVIANIGGPAVFDEYAKLVAAWFIVDSNAQGKALVHRIDAYPILRSFADSLVKYVGEGCAGCDVATVVQNSAADAGSQKVVPSVVSALKRDPSAKYLLTCDLEFFDGLPSAMSAAGLTDVKVAGQNPTLAGLGLLQSGRFAMAPSHPSAQAGWVAVDVAIRHAMGLPIPEDVNQMPTQVLLPGGQFVTDRLVDDPIDFAAQFRTLWNV